MARIELPDYDPDAYEVMHRPFNEELKHRLRPCAECETVFACYPEIHGWRYGNVLYCSYHCMRAAERRRLNPDRRAAKAEELIAEEKREKARRARALEEAERRIAECEKEIGELTKKRSEAKLQGEKAQLTKSLTRWKKEHAAAIKRHEKLLTKQS